MNITLLKNFNNYYNRIILKFDTFAEYTSAYTYKTLTDIDFDPKDGVDTEQIFNWSENYTPDYILVTEQVGNANATTTEIRSRWFVIEWTRVRGKQYRAKLRRDVIADNYSKVVSNKCFIEKGYAKSTDSAIYNKEDIQTNQIKLDEFLLKDETQCPWVVAYVAKQKNDGTPLPSTAWNDITIPNADATDAHVSEEYDTWQDYYDAHPKYDLGFDVLDYVTFRVRCDICIGNSLFNAFCHDEGILCMIRNDGYKSYQSTAFENNIGLHGKNKAQGDRPYYLWADWFFNDRDSIGGDLVKNYTGSVKDQMITELQNSLNTNFVDKNNVSFKDYMNYVKTTPVIKVAGRFYRVKDATNPSQSGIINCSVGSKAYNLFNNNLNRNPKPFSSGSGDTISGTPYSETFSYDYKYQNHHLVFEEIFAQVKIKNIGTPNILHDAPYYMFAIPYSDELTLYDGIDEDGEPQIHCEKTMKSIALSAAQNLAAQAGAGVVYDVQLLPYCPVRECIKTEYVPEGEIQDFLSDHGSYITIIRRLPGQPNKKKLALNKKYYIDANDLPEDEDLILASNNMKVSLHLPNEITQHFTAAQIHINHTLHTVSIYDQMHALLHTVQIQNLIHNDQVLEFELTDSIDEVATNYNNSSIVAFKDVLDPGYFSYVDIGEVPHTDIVKVVEGGTDQVLSTILWCTTSQFSFNITLEDNYLMTKDIYYLNKFTGKFRDSLEVGYDEEEIKIRNQCDMLRMCSPNYSNFFDLNTQMNKGVKFFNVDCTYKPYQPYIHLNPDFDGLYGTDYNDIRGLICGGDYSIALTTDAWATYQLNNKNYMAAFDRNIQVLETQNTIAKQSDVYSAIAGTVSGATTGALSGAMVGGGIGAAVGGVVGGITSLGAGLADVQNNELLRNLNISNMRDQFGYQLDNIKALPQGLAKTSAFTNNNKLFPVIEYYSCTNEEREAVRNKIVYNGMTIMRIGRIKDFTRENELTYIKGKLIRTDVADDFHMVAVINDELQKGVYL